MTGLLSYHAGLSAEDQVARDYDRRGYAVAAQRWRGKGGEIDLVLRDGAGYVFVEVKKSRNFARAADRLTPRQILRLRDAAAEFLGQSPTGLDTAARFDVALVDGIGQIHIVENALIG
ncbi:MAG: YraN family protein [Rhodobacter sp.]|nr:YraN family protein [Paracoccaceae bacterium]MCB1409107.1 YraN family protein [Paracoccaceae bacterium]MCC0079526.1 YraN family protein [Rhodobacter sp.]